MTDRIPPGSMQDADRPHVFWYPRPERLVIDAAQYAKPDSRDARIAQLTTALQHVQRLAADRAALETIGLDNVLDAIAVLAVDALAGEAQPSATVYEELAI